MVGGVGNLGRVVVADFGSERGDQHQGILNVVVDDVAIHFDAVNAVIHEGVAGVGEQFDRVEIVENHDRLENIQFKVALRAGKADRGIVAHHLHGYHGDG